MLRLSVSIHDSKKIKKILRDMIEQSRKQRLNDLSRQSHIFIALDIWISFFQQSFLIIIDYFIDEKWKYREVFLNFAYVSKFHTNDNLYIKVMNILKFYNIQSRLLIMTVNNAVNNNKMSKILEKMTRSFHEQFDNV